jgi:hypothetical protein
MVMHYIRKNYIYNCQFFGCHVLVLKPDSDVYEEVDKPLLEEVRPQVDPRMSTYGPSNSPLKKRLKMNLDYE